MQGKAHKSPPPTRGINRPNGWVSKYINLDLTFSLDCKRGRARPRHGEAARALVTGPKVSLEPNRIWQADAARTISTRPALRALPRSTPHYVQIAAAISPL
jgi:hypothetical protein